MRPAASTPRVGEALDALIYELLDAHTDTAVLAADRSHELHWAAHLDYLRALHRHARQELAHIALGKAA